MNRPCRTAAVILCLLLPAAAGAAPSGSRQPVAFPHVTHYTAYRIPCLFCHSYAERSAVAGIPPTSKCMYCHGTPGRPGEYGGVAPDRPEAEKDRQAWRKKEAIAWTRVADAPDHVHFPHNRHVTARPPVPCLHCHPGMDRATTAVQKQEFGMGWCMACHRKRSVSIDCWTCHA